MTKSGKIVFGIAGLIGIGLAWKYIRETLNKFRFKVSAYGVPSYENWLLRLPITLQFNNPTGITINTDQVLVDVYVRIATGEFIHVGRVLQPITIGPGQSYQTVVPVLNLQAVAGTLANSIKNILAAKSVTIRTDLTVTYKGIKLPTQEFIDTVKL